VARGLCYKTRGSIGRVSGEGKVPTTCDYDLWCGPAPKEPLKRSKLHYDWHWVWATGNGDLGNQGIHQMDVARWGLGAKELARDVISFGGRFSYVDDGETANTQVALFNFPQGKLIFEVRGLTTDDMLADRNGKATGDKRQSARVGNVFECEKGYLVCSTYSEAVACNPDGSVLKVFTSRGGENGHFSNFVKAVRSRKAEDLHADILEGHLSSALCHLANISHRLGTEQSLADIQSAGKDTDLQETLGRMAKHLKANGVKLESTRYSLGKKLTLDPKSETFPGDADANKMLTREYRKGFEVPGHIA
jgi:hypothetical protein